MAKRMEYTQNEWLLLGRAPVQVGMAVMGAGATSPFQIVRELIGIDQALRETSQASGATALIRELNVETQAQLTEISQQTTEAIDFAQMRSQTPDLCRKVAGIVDAKESAAAAEQYKRWLLWIGRRVAAAAREDPSQAISPDEVVLLEAIADALGVAEPYRATGEGAPAHQAPVEPAPTTVLDSQARAAGGAEAAATAEPENRADNPE
jgi:hypothetical protein